MPKNSKIRKLLSEKIDSVGTPARDNSQPECFIPKSADKKYKKYGFCSWCKNIEDNGYWLYGDLKRPICIECADNLLPSTASTVIDKNPVESLCSPQFCAQVHNEDDTEICQCCAGATADKKTYYIRALNKSNNWVDVVVCVKYWKSVAVLL